MLGLGRFCRIVVGAAPLVAGGAQAQVDWSELLGEKGSQPVAEAPQRQDVSPPAAQPPVQQPPRARSAVKARSKPARVRQTTAPHARRQVMKRDPEDEREYPAVPGASRR